MELKQNPFSLYDFLGYLIPGLLFLFGVWGLSNHLATPTYTFSELLKSTDALSTASYIAIALIAYVSGHFLSYCSSMTIERYSEWTLGFPSKFLLAENNKSYFNIGEKKPIHYLVRLLMLILLLPISLFDFIFGKSFSLRESYAKKIEEPLLQLVNTKLSAILNNAGIFSTHSNDSFFRYFYHYAVENCKTHFPKMQNYVALFGFMRTLTFLSIVLFWVVLSNAYFFYGFSTHLIILLFSLSAISVVFYLGFVKFYRRYSLEVYMAITTC